MQVTLISHTPELLKVLYAAARTCYSEHSPQQIWQDSSDTARMQELIGKIVASGHHSVLEHVSFTFAVQGISRAASHQLVRHRLASYSQQSQRYVGGEHFDYVVPPAIQEHPELLTYFTLVMEGVKEAYSRLVKEGMAPEDARFVLPNATATNIVVSMNGRELRHFFQVRCCRRAQWEIRQLAWRMLSQCQQAAGFLFENCGPGCLTSECHEGERSCQHPYSSEEVEELLQG